MKSARTISSRSAFYLAACLILALCTCDNRGAWAQFPAPPGSPQFPAPSGSSQFPAPPGPAAPHGVQCSDVEGLAAEAQKRSALVGAAIKAKGDRKELCTLMTNFITAESKVVKFLQDNKVYCHIPDQVTIASKSNHEKALKFRTAACEEGPRPKTPTLSDAIKAPSVDSSKNTNTGRGTFDTLTGNPLGR
jgi:hypothetical protein